MIRCGLVCRLLTDQQRLRIFYLYVCVFSFPLWLFVPRSQDVVNGHRVVFPGVVVSYDVTVGYSNTVVEFIQASLSLVVFGTDVPCLHPGCALTSRTEALSILYGTSGYVMGFSDVSLF